MRRQLDRSDIGIEGVALRLDRGRHARVDGVPREVHGVGAHVTDLAGAKVPKHIPLEAICSGATGEIARIVGVIRRRTDPLIVMQRARGLTLGCQVTGARELAVAPHKHALQITDGTIFDQLAHPREVGIRVPLRARLRGDFVLFLQILGPHQAGLFDAQGDRLLHVNVQPAVHRPNRDVRMMVVRRATHDRVEPFMIEALSPIDVGLRTGKFRQRLREAQLVHIAQRDDVFFGEPFIVGESAAPDADERDVEFLVGRILSKQRAAPEDRESGSGDGRGFEEMATVHR